MAQVRLSVNESAAKAMDALLVGEAVKPSDYVRILAACLVVEVVADEEGA